MSVNQTYHLKTPTRNLKEILKEAIYIRRVEERLLSLFKEGLLNGTVHTCIGQEFSALAFCKPLEPGDFVFSNHRCHGHYLAFTRDYRGLIAEIMGKKTGVCGGIGGSQHLCKDNFFSNGILGGTISNAAGISLANKLRSNGQIGVVFIGDGALGEGAVYETLNIISKWELPILVVLENNYYSQSTPQELTLKGSIMDRIKACDMKCFEDSTEDYEKLLFNAETSLDFVRREKKPAFHLVHTSRLAAHSTGDDLRDEATLNSCWKKDPIFVFSKSNVDEYEQIISEIDGELDELITEIKHDDVSQLSDYIKSPFSKSSEQWDTFQFEASANKKLVHKLNEAFHQLMKNHDDILFIGEDILSPYGGAFKVLKDLSFKYEDRVFTTPVSEAAITGIANGLALNGYRPFLEIMFGDFITLAFDQIVNHATKYHLMYNKQVNCPVVIRTPMGGKRGFGPTHSQTLDKLLLGVNNLKVIAINALIDPFVIYDNIYRFEKNPVVVIENKADYARRFPNVTDYIQENYHCRINNQRYPILKFSPKQGRADISIVTYGAMIEDVFKATKRIFYEEEILPEIIILSQIHPLPVQSIVDSLSSHFLFTVEEGSASVGFGSELIASVLEIEQKFKMVKRIASHAVPIPSARHLEDLVLVNSDTIVREIKKTYCE